jgi:predicted phage terminase large subunit-like protein
VSDFLGLDGFADLQQQLLRVDYNQFATAALAPLGQAPARHHRVLNAELQRWAERRGSRLIVMMPPGAAKSTYCSVLFPPWLMQFPGIETIITASASADLAEAFLTKAYRVATEMAPILGYGFEQARLNTWRTDNGRELRAFGAGAGTAGRRADAVIIDDPFGSWADAARQGKRDEIWDWYTGDIVNRLRPGGRVLIVLTHWNQDDIAGRLIEHMGDGGEIWDIVRMQAIYDGSEPDPLGRQVGEALWPEWEGVEALEIKRGAIGEMKWASLFQQNPVAAMGLLFPVEKIGARDAMPEGPRISCRYWDLASTESRIVGVGDWTVGLKLTQVGEGHWVVEDVRRVKLSPDGVKQLMLQTAADDGRGCIIGLPQDPGSAGKFVVSDLTAMLKGYIVKPERETGSKETRAEPVASQVEAGNVSMMRAPWNAAFIEELRAFPNGKHDDQVDGLAGAFKRLFKPARKTQAINVPWGVR